MKMAQYLDECWDFGMPKKKSEFQNEVVHYMECYKIPNKFPNIKPGYISFCFYMINLNNVNSAYSEII